jgi:hypothetical protein
MHGMQYPPERTIRPEEILPIGTNPIGRIEKTLRFFLFSQLAGQLPSQKNLVASHASPLETCGKKWSACC